LSLNFLGNDEVRRTKTTNRSAILKIRAQARRMIHRLNETGTDPTNADRALWGALAIVDFATATGRTPDILSDAETLLADLLADLMHWCDVQKANRGQEAIEFGSALQRARDYYEEEYSDESEQGCGPRE
jgi:hypothetical protein